MGWATTAREALQSGESVEIRPRGHSMTGKVNDRDHVTLAPCDPDELVKGDAPEGLRKYLDAHPETIVAFAYFDMDLYEPTRECLEILKDYTTKGTVIGFDELC